MALSKRQLLKFLIAGSLLSSALGAGAQQQYPNKPIKIVVGFAAGGLTDQIARLVAQGLSKRMGQQVIVENRPGGNLVPATLYVAKAPADGYILHLGNGQPFSVNVAYYKTIPYDANDYTAVAVTSEIPMGIYVASNSPFKTLGELVAFAKANPNKMNYGSPGQLSQGALGMEAFKSAAGVDIQHIAYQGGAPALLAMLGGHVDLILSDIATAAPHIKAGKVRVLGISHKQRLATMPEVPTFTEAGFANVEIPVIWNGVFAPPKTPKAIVDKLNAEINAVMQTPELVKFLEESSLLPYVDSPQKMEALVKSDYATYVPLIKRLGLKSE